MARTAWSADDGTDEHCGDDADEADHDAAAHAQKSQTQATDLKAKLGPQLAYIGIDASESGVHPVREIVEPLIVPGRALHDPRLPPSCQEDSCDFDATKITFLVWARSG